MVRRRRDGNTFCLSVCLPVHGVGQVTRDRDRERDKEWGNNVSLLTCRAATHQRVCLCYYKNPLIPNASLWN